MDGMDLDGAREHVLGYLVTFARALRERGAEVPANASVAAARALAEVGLGDRELVRTALRATLVTRREDIETFESLFPGFWRQLRGEDREFVAPEQGAEAPGVDPAGAGGGGDATGPDAGEPIEAEPAAIERSVEPAAGGEGEGPEAATASVYSPAGRPEPIEMRLPAADDGLAEPVARLTDALATLRGRRWTRTGGERVDTRRALRRSLGTGGAVLSLPRRDRERAAVRAAVLVDVSGSVLDTIDREFLLRFLHRVRREWREARVFFFDTSVREVTGAFDAPTTAAAADALERAEAEWGGGTRIGNALDTVRREYPDAVDRETVALVISDGLEVGEIGVLEGAMSWLSRRSGAVLWLNPLAASPEYEPACRGMAAALPYVDGLFAFAGADDVAEMARQLDRRGAGGRIGYRYDPRRG